MVRAMTMTMTMTMTMRRRLLFVALPFLMSCGDDSPTPDQSCQAQSQAICAKIDQCDHPAVVAAYGDVATCAARFKIDCLNSMKATGSSTSPTMVQSCAKAVPGLTCAQSFTRDIPTACMGNPGAFADGTGCGADGQCKSTYCRKAVGQSCGTCGPRAAAGASCTRAEDCDYKLTCANQKCVAFATGGGACNADTPCLPGLFCQSSVCAVAGGPGASCTTQPECDGTQALFCNPLARACQLASFAMAGQACGVVTTPQVGFSLCSGGATCNAPQAGSGVCVAAAADGAACNAANSIGCLAPATCTSGTCKLPDPAACH
jgi:hypothetical protein